jgi:hypothetical protein
MIHTPENYLKIKTKISVEFLSLPEFQTHLKFQIEKNLSKNKTFTAIDILKIYFSALMFEEGITYIAEEYVVDAVNIGFIISEINLIEPETIKSSMELFLQTYVNHRTFEIINYVKYYYNHCYLEKIRNIFETTKKYSILLDPNSLFYSYREKKVEFSDIIPQNDYIKLVNDIVKNAITSENEDSNAVILELAKSQNLYYDMITLILKDSVEMIMNKIPQMLRKDKTIRTDTKLQTIKEKYSGYINEVNNNINSLNKISRFNLRALLQLQSIEDIYNLVNQRKEGEALEVFISKVDFP